MPMEEWKDIEGYEGYYQISSEGRVRSLDRVVICKDGTSQFNKGRVLKQNTTKCGYNTIPLYKEGGEKWYSVHRLVAEAFLEIPEELKKYIGTRKLQVNHKNEFDKTDNRVSNLEWMSAKDNTNYGTCIQRRAEKQKNSPKRSKKIYQYDLNNNLVKVWESVNECNRNGFNSGGIWYCERGIKDTYKGFKWSHKPLEAPNNL